MLTNMWRTIYSFVALAGMAAILLPLLKVIGKPIIIHSGTSLIFVFTVLMVSFFGIGFLAGRGK